MPKLSRAQRLAEILRLNARVFTRTRQLTLLSACVVGGLSLVPVQASYGQDRSPGRLRLTRENQAVFAYELTSEPTAGVTTAAFSTDENLESGFDPLAQAIQLEVRKPVTAKKPPSPRTTRKSASIVPKDKDDIAAKPDEKSASKPENEQSDSNMVLVGSRKSFFKRQAQSSKPKPSGESARLKFSDRPEVPRPEFDPSELVPSDVVRPKVSNSPIRKSLENVVQRTIKATPKRLASREIANRENTNRDVVTPQSTPKRDVVAESNTRRPGEPKRTTQTGSPLSPLSLEIRGRSTRQEVRDLNARETAPTRIAQKADSAANERFELVLGGETPSTETTEAEESLTFSNSNSAPSGEKSLSLELDAEKPTTHDVSEHADGKECPGAPKDDNESGADGEPKLLPDDVPLEEQPHPYDAPAAKSEAEPDPSIEPRQAFSAREVSIHRRINETLDYFLTHPETVVRRGPWALMHASLPFGVETEVVAGNRRVNALGWMCYNGVCAKQRMFQSTRTGFRTNVGPGVQGHEGQFLAILAQSRVESSYPIKVGRRSYTIKDLVRYEMATCRERSELTFKLIGLSYYLKPDQRWRDNRGRTWNLEKMVAEELAQPINGVACGGSHRLMGLSFAIIERQRAGLPITGTWARAEKYLNDYINYTMSLQNPDGSFSTNWFEGRGNKADTERKVQTTGHMLEWLIYTLPDDYLRSPRIQVSVEYLLRSVGANPGYNWPIGPRGHALRALALYNQRVFGAEQGNLKQYIATQKANGTLR